MFRFFGVAFAVMVSFASPAQAGWSNTDWGMTEGRVRELYPEATPNPAERLYTLVKRPHDFAGVEWSSVAFKFDANGVLQEVQLVADGRKYGNQVRDALIGQLGSPVERSPNRYVSTTTWRQPERDNIIEFADMGFAVMVTYKQIPQAF